MKSNKSLLQKMSDIKESESRYLNKSILLKESRNPILYRALIKLCTFLVIAFILWAYFMQVDEVAIARGEIIPSSDIQNVQHPHGGVIREILVKNGEFVSKGQVLMQLDHVSSESVLEQSKIKMENYLLQKERLETFIKYMTITAQNEKLNKAPKKDTPVLKLMKKLDKCGVNIPQGGEMAEVGTIKLNKAKSVNLRKGPGTNHKVDRRANSYERVLVIGYKKRVWANIYDSRCHKVWIHTDLINVKNVIIPQVMIRSLPAEPDFSKVPSNDFQFIEEQQRIYEQQVTSFKSNRKGMDSKKSQLRQDLKALYREESTLKSQYSLWSKEYSIKKKLSEQGVFSKVDLIQIQRKVSEIKGKLSQIRPKVNKTRSSITEEDRRLEKMNAELLKENSTELSNVNSQIVQLEEVLKRDAQDLQQQSIKAPVAGMVHGLAQNTIGGVINQSETIMSIIPQDEELVAEVKISSIDIGHIVVGQPSVLKFTTFTYQKYGGIKGLLTDVSPTTFKDKTGGEPYYRGKIVLSKNYLGNDPSMHHVMPGMTIQAAIKTGGKSLLEYILSPIQRAASEGMQER